MKDIKYYDKQIENDRTSLIEVITITIVFLVSFLFGYSIGLEEGRTNEEMQNLSMVSLHKNAK